LARDPPIFSLQSQQELGRSFPHLPSLLPLSSSLKGLCVDNGLTG
jgi:hypothetical protein